MLDRWTDVSGKLREQQVEASAPCRVDCGGSTDHRLTGLLCRAASPATATIALDLRTVVRLEPHDPGRLAVEAGGLASRTHRSTSCLSTVCWGSVLPCSRAWACGASKRSSRRRCP